MRPGVPLLAVYGQAMTARFLRRLASRGSSLGGRVPAPCRHDPVRRIRYLEAMRFQRDSAGKINLIHSYEPGLLRIGDRNLRRSVVVSAEQLIENWRPCRPGELEAHDLEPLLEWGPEIVLIGTGRQQFFPDERRLTALRRAGIGVEIMDTGAACRTFNLLAAEGRRVAAALILENE